MRVPSGSVHAHESPCLPPVDTIRKCRAPAGGLASSATGTCAAVETQASIDTITAQRSRMVMIVDSIRPSCPSRPSSPSCPSLPFPPIPPILPIGVKKCRFVRSSGRRMDAVRIVCMEVRMKQLRELGAVLVLAAAIFAPAAIAAQAPAPGGLPDLVGALKATPGVLGVDAGQMISGKQVIFAWFENKQAVLNWYNSDVHRRLMNRFSSGPRRPDGPLAGIKEDSGPILTIASITMDP